jgi:hypothetical protein
MHLSNAQKRLMLLTTPRALAGGIEETKPNGVLTQITHFGLKPICICPVLSPWLKRGG